MPCSLLTLVRDPASPGERLEFAADVAVAPGDAVQHGVGLTWEQVDWEGAVIRLSATVTKAKRPRVFPFGAAPELRTLLETQWAARDGAFVFQQAGRPLGDFRKAWGRACARAGLAGRLVHDLRRTAARDFRRAGLAESEIMKLCGWETAAMFRRYDIVSEADLAQAVAKRFANGNGTGPSTGTTQKEVAPSL